MTRLMLAVLLAFVLVTGNFMTVPRATYCDDRTSGIFKGATSRCPMPLWRQGSTILA
jgi:hypothetical protein